MVVIRLARGGTKKRPFYRIVAADKRFARDGRYIEQLGTYNPIAAGEETSLKINVERLQYWQNQGAQVSQRVAKLAATYQPQDNESKAA